MPKEIFEVVRERFHLSDRTQYIVQGHWPKDAVMEAYLDQHSAVLAHMPQAITLIFGGSGIVPAALFAIILNIVLPPDEKSEVEIAEEILDMKKKEAQKK